MTQLLLTQGHEEYSTVFGLILKLFFKDCSLTRQYEQRALIVLVASATQRNLGRMLLFEWPPTNESNLLVPYTL